jgi:hypothetical protein
MRESIRHPAGKKAPFDRAEMLVVALWIVMTIITIAYLAKLRFL